MNNLVSAYIKNKLNKYFYKIRNLDVYQKYTSKLCLCQHTKYKILYYILHIKNI